MLGCTPIPVRAFFSQATVSSLLAGGSSVNQNAVVGVAWTQGTSLSLQPSGDGDALLT